MSKIALIFLLMLLSSIVGVSQEETSAHQIVIEGAIHTESSFDIHIYECNMEWTHLDTTWVPNQRRGTYGYKSDYILKGMDTRYKYIVRFKNSCATKWLFLDLTKVEESIWLELDINDPASSHMLLYYDTKTDQVIPLTNFDLGTI